MLPKKLVLPATCLLVLGAVGCSSSAHRVESDEYGYRVERSGAVDNSMTRYDDIENRNTTVSDNALRSERLESRYDEPIYSHNTTVFDNALNRGDSVERSEASFRSDSDIRSDVRSDDRDVLVSEDASLRSDDADLDISSSASDSDVAGTTTTTTTTVSESGSSSSEAPGSYSSMYNQGSANAAAPSAGTAAGATAGTAAGMSASERSDSRSVSNAAASQANAYNFVEISFEPGSTGLTESAKSSLRSVVEQAKAAGKLDEAIVMSWSDEEYPSKEVKKLPKYQRDLADNRNKAVKDFIKSVQKMDIDTYNMAAQPNTVSKWFNTTDARLKNSLSAAGLPTTAEQQQYPSKASHSLVLIKVE
ncbi:MAG: hypothetical protein K0R29_487 [Pseudobdellovibrio sp.]|jgi:hypothetical protein|nr:hypothetical protein [Pseudobdellovibrio sp.]